MKFAIKQFAQMPDHKTHDSAIIVVLTHGHYGVLYGVDSNPHNKHDEPYYVDEMVAEMYADKCTALAGKPKLFLIQACRGS